MCIVVYAQMQQGNMHFRICRGIGHHFKKFVHTQTLVKNAATEIQGLEDPHTRQ